MSKKITPIPKSIPRKQPIERVEQPKQTQNLPIQPTTTPLQETYKEPTDLFARFVYRLRPSVIKRNWSVVRSNPGAAVNFQARAYKMLFWVMSIIIGYQFLKVLIGFNAGSSMFTQVGRAFTILVGVLIINEIYKKFYKPMQAMATHYNALPPAPPSNVNVNKTVDDTLKYFQGDQNTDE